MKQTWRLAVVCLALLCLSAVQAEAATELHPLAKITNDRNEDVHRMSLMVDDDGTVEGIHVATQKNDQNPPKITERTFSVSKIGSKDGAVLDGDDEHAAIILQGKIDSEAGESTLKVRYLSNGLFGKYKSCDVGLVRSASGDWRLKNSYNKKLIKEVHVVTWSLGISTIQGICP